MVLPRSEPQGGSPKGTEYTTGCGYLTLPMPQKEAVSYICPVCFWENDVFIQSAAEPSDENHGMTLAEARENFRQFGACCEQMLSYVRKAFPEEIPKDHS